jgi:hypothetical protein
VMFLLRLAQMYNKVLLFSWSHPIPIEDVLQPNMIDWTLNGLPLEQVTMIHSDTQSDFDDPMNWGQKLTKFLSLIETGKGAESFEREQVSL